MSESDNEEIFVENEVNTKASGLTSYEIYFRDQEKYSKIYGEKTIVFHQIGKFYEAYCNETRGYLKLRELEQLLNIRYINREDLWNKKIKGSDCNKPSQFGINCVSIKKNLTTLIENGYTVALFDQKTSDGEKIERELVNVYSPGTFLSDVQLQDTNYLMTVYISEEKQLNGKILMVIGVSVIDITMGNSIVHEFNSNILDEKFGLDELSRMIQIFRPTETVIYYHPIILNEKTVTNIQNYLEMEKIKNNHFYIYHNKKGNDQLNLLIEDSFKINYQNNYLSVIFDLNSQLSLNKKKSALEVLNLERMQYATISLMIMLKYVSEHNTSLLKNLSYPNIYLYHKHLILGNNAIEQLNIIDCNNMQVYNQKFKSLFDVVNKTCTPMGKRLLKESLVNPLSQENKTTILKKYDLIEKLLKDKFYLKIRDHLKNIYDMERLHRKMAMGMITPYEFYRLDLFYQATIRIIGETKKNNIIESMISESSIQDFMKYHIDYNKKYDMDKMQMCTKFDDIEGSFFKKNVHDNLDKLQDKIDYIWSLINCTKMYFNELITGKCKKNWVKEILVMESNDREGYYFTITKANEKILKGELAKKKKIKISLSVNEVLDMNPEDIIFKPLPKGRTKIFIPTLVEHTVQLSKHIKKLNKEIKKVFICSMLKYYADHKATIHKICKFVAEIDYLVSGATVADEYSYCKPNIPSTENIPSYLQVKELRHPIVERLCNETEYIPNDFELGNIPVNLNNKLNNKENIEKNGVVLYGLNSSGKSSLMKAIGISIILAQIGYYVPAREFIYEPYMSLYARITGNDNFYKGLSSFDLEMTELDAILMRTENQGLHTIVIGDEVCRGTESISGRAIVASALVALSEFKSTFIFSSHLHDLQHIDEVKNLKNLRFYHLRVEFDEANDCLIFDRKLTPGSGPSVYGLSVAKYLIKNAKFINRAEIIKKRILNEDKFDIPIKKSNYNKDLLVTCCAICHYRPTSDYYKELETHHIHFQQNCLEDGKIKEKPYLHKNKLYNLVILCRKCHVKVHQGEIIIKGYSDTSIGPLLDYKTDIKKKITNNLNMLKMLDIPNKHTNRNKHTQHSNRNKHIQHSVKII